MPRRLGDSPKTKPTASRNRIISSDGLRDYRARIARLLSYVGMGVALLVLVPNLSLELSAGHSLIVAVEAVSFAFLATMVALGRLVPVLRPLGLVTVVFGLGAFLLAEKGIAGPGAIWLGAAIVLASVLFGSPGSAVLSVMSALAFAIVARAAGGGRLAADGTAAQIGFLGLNTVGLSTVSSLAGTRLVAFLGQSLKARERLDVALRERECALEEESAERKGAEALAAFYRDFDGLTHLPNRDKFLRELGVATMQASRHDRLLAVMSIGFERFSRISGSMGHEASDAFLLEVSAALRGCFRDDDLVGRLGDELFGVICADLRRSEDLMDLIEKARDCLDRSFDLGAGRYRPGATLGIALYPNDALRPEDLLKASESALRLARQAGPGSYRLFDAGLDRDFLDRLKLEAELEAALFTGAIIPWFQPKVDSAGRVIGAEALARWRLPDGGIRMPAAFIPVAEGSGEIRVLGQAVLEGACACAARWERLGLPPIPVSVNLSPYQFRSPTLAREVEKALRQSGLDPSRLELEITESGLAAVEEDAVERLTQLKALGISLSIDDFGTGSSTISRLRDYPIDAVKVPKAFVDPLPRDSKASMIARAVIELAHNLEFEVVAEGIEERSQFDWLKSAACDQYQGFFFAPPLPAEEFEGALAKGYSAIVQ
jgi:diguanylate cyclase (GGDEF)-like protein